MAQRKQRQKLVQGKGKGEMPGTTKKKKSNNSTRNKPKKPKLEPKQPSKSMKPKAPKKQTAPNDRVILEISHFNEKKQIFVLRERLTVSQLQLQDDGSHRIELPRGGSISVFPNYVSEVACKAIQEEVLGVSEEDPCGLLRQYRMQTSDEPRLHALLSCDDDDRPNSDGSLPQTACTYSYHGIHMMAHEHISNYPAMEELSKKAADDCGIQGWKIGLDAILYRNGNDKIGFHADDTQGEDTIFCAVVQSEDTRFLRILPDGKTKKQKKKNKDNYKHGDYEIKIYAVSGDAYKMDGEMQKNYVHALPKTNRSKFKHQSRRMALIFRDGDKVKDDRDSGSKARNLEGKLILSPEQKYPFGPYRAFLTEGAVYYRTYLLDSLSFGSVQGGVSGIKSYGCNAIVVSRQSEELYEYDNLDEISYSSNGRQGGGSLFRSFQQKHPIRVFRTSSLEGPYGACRGPNAPKQIHKPPKQMYRYDGVYEIVECLEFDDVGGFTIPTDVPVGDTLYTFKLRRLPCGGENSNQLSLTDLKSAISKGEILGTMDNYPSLQVAKTETVPCYRQQLKRGLEDTKESVTEFEDTSLQSDKYPSLQSPTKTVPCDRRWKHGSEEPRESVTLKPLAKEEVTVVEPYRERGDRRLQLEWERGRQSAGQAQPTWYHQPPSPASAYGHGYAHGCHPHAYYREPLPPLVPYGDYGGYHQASMEEQPPFIRVPERPNIDGMAVPTRTRSQSRKESEKARSKRGSRAAEEGPMSRAMARKEPLSDKETSARVPVLTTALDIVSTSTRCKPKPTRARKTALTSDLEAMLYAPAEGTPMDPAVVELLDFLSSNQVSNLSWYTCDAQAQV